MNFWYLPLPPKLQGEGPTGRGHHSGFHPTGFFPHRGSNPRLASALPLELYPSLPVIFRRRFPTFNYRGECKIGSFGLKRTQRAQVTIRTRNWLGPDALMGTLYLNPASSGGLFLCESGEGGRASRTGSGVWWVWIVEQFPYSIYSITYLQEKV